MAKRSAPEVNAGSMADIAFLLLIFFLVTTTIETDSGIQRKLPPEQLEDQPPPPKIKERNLFVVNISGDRDLLVEDELMDLSNLREATIAFLDNGAENCDYCQGDKDPESSVNPDKAIISMVNSRKTSYKRYIAVQNELVAAYNFLRNRESERLYGESFTSLEAKLKDARISEGQKEQIKPKLDRIREMYPEKLSEAEPK